MSCTSPRTVPITMVPLPASSDFSMCGSSRATAAFMTSADWSTNGSCISPLPKRCADDLHAGEQVLVDDLERAQPALACEVEVGLQALGLAVDDAALETLADRQSCELGGPLVLERGRVDAGEQVEQRRQRVVGQVAVGVVLALVPDQVHRDLAAVVGHRCQRHDLRGVDDRRVESRLDRLVQEHRVEHRARGRVQAERDVRDAEGGVDAGILRRDLPDRVDGLDRVAPGLLLAGRDREGERVHDDVVDPHAPFVDEGVDESGGDAHLVLGGARLALLVDGQGDHGGAVLLDERHDAPEPRCRALAVLEVDRVDDRSSADELHTGLQHGGLGGVDDERQGRGAREPRDGLLDVGDAVAPDVVDADIQQVGALAHLVAGDVDAVVPALLEHRLAEGERAVRVGALADRQVGGILIEADVLVEARDPGILFDDAGRAPAIRRCDRRRP